MTDTSGSFKTSELQELRQLVLKQVANAIEAMTIIFTHLSIDAS